MSVLSPCLVFIPQGSAAFWYNLKQNGDPDMRTIHAGCPVLIGDKWGKHLNNSQSCANKMACESGDSTLSGLLSRA